MHLTTTVGTLSLAVLIAGCGTHCSGTPWVLIGEDFRRLDAAVLTPEETTALPADIAAGKPLRITIPDATVTALLAPPIKKQKEALGSLLSQPH